ncbi:MAG: glycosyl transferase family 1 [Cytophagales bacterium CG12_big_fil_rev_8_21_14_0_65_40_12]|nr:MAG: glycosyl transferase family 1 [Cytophagales bacterium CG12_big_fil_rev_8_21_14_0_65_40_12]PIW03788.1 MAG: glycosyl transferase family 1 [Cytophagales bacterium CG17_big_fil_post_rev_8_21_14_2_50_40_13]
MSETSAKKVLIITYYWPPSGGGGVQRWLKFAKYLPQYGWEPIIFTPENPDFDLKDSSLLEDIPKEVEVLKFPIWEPYSIFKKLSGRKELKQGQVLEGGKKGLLSSLAIWLRGNLFIPDPRLFWVKPSVNYISSILASNQIETIITTGPPHSMHLIGLKLKMRQPALTWIADFRDPWTKWDILSQFKMSKWAWARHQQLEQNVIRSADCVLTVSNSWKKDFEKLGAKRTRVITNGFDAADFKTKKKVGRPAQFVISHIGMLNVYRNPEWLWSVLEAMVSEGAFNNDLKIEFIGILSDDVLKSFENYPNLKPLIQKENYLPHDKVIEKYDQSALLLLLQNDSENAKGHLPGKFFEYLGARRTILCVGNRDSDLSQILKATEAGEVFDSKSSAELKVFLIEAYQQWQAGNSQKDSGNISRFERKSLTGDLDQLLKSLR